MSDRGPRRPAVWRRHDFAVLWAGQTVSEVGSQVTTLALPTLAIFSLHAGPAAVGLLVACGRLPFPVLSLFAGAVVDRLRKRRLMIVCDVARLLILAVIPALAATGHLTLGALFAAAIAMGVFTVFFDIAYLAYVPILVDREQLLEANSRLEASFSAASLLGPGLGGLLTQAFGAARAVLADAGSFLVSALSLAAIYHHEDAATPSNEGHRLFRDIRAGLAHVFGHPVLRAQLLCMSAAIVFAHGSEPALYLFAYRTLRLSPGLLGTVLAVEGIGSVVATLFAMRVIGSVGVGPVVAVGDALAVGLGAAVPLATLVPPLLLLLPLFAVVGGLGTIGNVAQVTLRQSLSPAHLQGRMSAVFRAFFWGAWPLGNLLGGLLASTVGAATTLWTMGVVGAAVSLSLVVTPVWRVRALPATGQMVPVIDVATPVVP